MSHITKAIAIILIFTLLPINAVNAITIQEEEKISKEFLKSVFKYYKVIDDYLITEYVNRVGKKIVSSIPSPVFDYKFYVLKGEDYNAFAGPGGQIFIHQGLFEDLETEQELAGILGHEIAHVECRHISEKINRSKKMGIGTLAGIAAGIFLGVSGVASSAVAKAVTLGTVATSQTVSLAYSRDNEMEADKLGLKNLSASGYSGEGLLSTLKKIRAKQWFGSDQIPSYLVTHPAVEDRISYISSWLEKDKDKQKIKKDPSDDNYFDFIKIRLIALYGKKDTALKKCQDLIKKKPQNSLAYYGHGIVLARNGQLKEAITNLKTALKYKAFDPYILKELGHVYFLNTDYDKALQVFEQIVNIGIYDKSDRILFAKTFTQVGKFDRAISMLEVVLDKDPNNIEALYALGDVYSRKGNNSFSHYYTGLYYKNRGDFKNALFHLKRALETINDKEKKENIKKILKELKKQKSKANRKKE